MTETGELEAIRKGLHHDDHEVRMETLAPLYEGEYDPSVIEALGEGLLALLSDEPYVPQRAIGSLRQAESLSPAQSDRLADVLAGDDWLVASRAVEVIDGISTASTMEAVRVAPALVAYLKIREDGSGATSDANDEARVVEHETAARRSFHHKRRMTAVTVLSRVAEADPSALSSEVEALVRIVGRRDRVDVRAGVLEVLTALAQANPERFVDAIDPLAAVLGESKALPIRSNTAYLLAMIAEAHGEAVAEAVAPHRGILYAMLESKPGVQNAAIGLLAYVGEHRPGVVEDEKDRIIGLLEHPVESVRGNAIWTLSYAPDDEVRDRLATLAEEDPSEEIRAHAAETAATLAAE